MKNYLFIAAACALSITCVNCGSDPHRVDPKSNQGLISMTSLDAKDFQDAALTAINEILESGVLRRADGRKTIIALTQIKNHTSAHINTEILTNQIRQAILKSGQAQFSTAIKYGGGTVDDVGSKESRELENSDLFNQDTVAKRGTLIAQDMTLTGEISQIKTKMNRSSENYYQITLRITNTQTGLEEWISNTEVMKQEQRNIFGW